MRAMIGRGVPQRERTETRRLATCRSAKSTAAVTSRVGCGGFPEAATAPTSSHLRVPHAQDLKAIPL